MVLVCCRAGNDCSACARLRKVRVGVQAGERVSVLGQRLEEARLGEQLRGPVGVSDTARNLNFLHAQRCRRRTAVPGLTVE